MKLGVSYSLFDGEELLEYSIKSIRNNVDFISVFYQELSYHGEPCAEGILEMLNDLKSRGLIDEIAMFTNDFSNDSPENPSFNQTRKRQEGLELSRKHGCTHHMTIDCDEFYTDEEFKYMKKVMEEGDFGSGACQHVQYYKDSIYILDPPEPEYVATIEKITPDTRYVYFIENTNIAIDPCRKTSNGNYRVFSRDEVQMHHMSFVRKNLRGKLENHTSKRFFTDEGVNKIVDHYNNWKPTSPLTQAMWAGVNLLNLKEVPRLFDIYKVDYES